MSVTKSRKVIDPIDVSYLRVANVQRGYLVLDKMKNILPSGENEVDFVTKSHFSLGRWIRNEWGLWGW
jgi:type I restriction enzyme S subunit